MAAAAMLLGMGSTRLVAQGAGAGTESMKMMAADAHPSFEVATIKPTDPNRKNEQGCNADGRHVWCISETVKIILMAAYGLNEKQVVDGPAWLGTDKYDIDGVSDIEGQPNLKQVQGMLKKLLADRFKLTSHSEKKELSVYALRVVKNGPKLTKSKDDPNGLPDFEITNWTSNLVFLRESNTTMEEFVLNLQFLNQAIDRPIVDQTALAGRYDFTLKWTPDEATTSDPNAPPGLFTAIQEQAGLKLEPEKTPVEVLVIDHIERPSAN
jgi:uncharacterized protein (TIGR03435 family)